MNIKILAGISVATLLFAAAPAFALQIATTIGATVSAGSSTVSASAAAKITTAKSRANQEITRRIGILNDLSTKVQAMVKVSADEKSAIANEVQAEISSLTSLNAKIQADTDAPTLKTDVQSIAIDYRIFMLIIPQGRIEVASDRIQTIAANYTTLSGTLQTRISQAPAGTDTTKVNAWLSDMNTQVANANAQAQAAVSLVANLQPDQGNAAVETSNKTALKNAAGDSKTALADLKTARQDAGSIVKTVESWKTSANASSSASVQ